MVSHQKVYSPPPITRCIAAAVEHMSQCSKDLQSKKKKKRRESYLEAILRENQTLIDTVLKVPTIKFLQSVAYQRAQYPKKKSKTKKQVVKPIQ